MGFFGLLSYRRRKPPPRFSFRISHMDPVPECGPVMHVPHLVSRSGLVDALMAQDSGPTLPCRHAVRFLCSLSIVLCLFFVALSCIKDKHVARPFLSEIFVPEDVHRRLVLPLFPLLCCIASLFTPFFWYILSLLSLKGSKSPYFWSVSTFYFRNACLVLAPDLHWTARL